MTGADTPGPRPEASFGTVGGRFERWSAKGFTRKLKGEI
jgi:hypothetical protein